MTMSGKTCLVTGATSGIGQEIAAALASLGATVIIVARDAARGAAAAAEIRRRAPAAQVETMTADLSSLPQVRGGALAGDARAGARLRTLSEELAGSPAGSKATDPG